MIQFSQCRLKSNSKSSQHLTEYLSLKCPFHNANNYLKCDQVTHTYLSFTETFSFTKALFVGVHAIRLNIVL